jgi:hypothetical protein
VIIMLDIDFRLSITALILLLFVSMYGLYYKWRKRPIIMYVFAFLSGCIWAYALTLLNPTEIADWRWITVIGGGLLNLQGVAIMLYLLRRND